MDRVVGETSILSSSRVCLPAVVVINGAYIHHNIHDLRTLCMGLSFLLFPPTGERKACSALSHCSPCLPLLESHAPMTHIYPSFFSSLPPTHTHTSPHSAEEKGAQYKRRGERHCNHDRQSLISCGRGEGKAHFPSPYFQDTLWGVDWPLLPKVSIT